MTAVLTTAATNPRAAKVPENGRSDVTFGLVDLGLDGAYRLHRMWSAGLALHYRAAIPTLCGTSSDYLPRRSDRRAQQLTYQHLKTFEPDVDLELGYEWLASKLVVTGATSEHGYRGFEA